MSRPEKIQALIAEAWQDLRQKRDFEAHSAGAILIYRDELADYMIRAVTLAVAEYGK